MLPAFSANGYILARQWLECEPTSARCLARHALGFVRDGATEKLGSVVAHQQHAPVGYVDPFARCPDHVRHRGVRNDDPGASVLLNRGHEDGHAFDAVAVATHLNPRWYSLFQLTWKTRVFQTDKGHGKIVRYLRSLGYEVNDEDVRAMCSRYGASYAIADIIRKHHEHEDFSECWERFRRFAQLGSRPNPDCRHWRLRFD